MNGQKRTPDPEVLIPRDDLQRRIGELAGEIRRDYAASRHFIVLGVLKGSVFFMVDLLQQVDLVLAVDFFQTSSYRDSTTPGELRIRKDIDLSIRDADVLIVEDIVDTGDTMRTVLDLMRFRGARSVKLCALLDKWTRRQVEVPIDYRGFKIDDVFVVGYGLDYADLYRNLPYIGVLPDAGES